MKTVAKAIRLLKMFSAEHEEWGASELGRAVAMDKVIVHRLLRALAEGELLVQDATTRRYRMGPGLIALAHRNLGSMDVTSLARPYLERLRDETGETILLSVRRGNVVVVTLPCESRQAVRVSAEVGDSVPMYCSASGRVFLAFGPATLFQEIDATPMPALTAHTITNLDEIGKQLVDIKRRGWAIDDEELADGVRAVAAPVFGPTGDVECCVALRAPSGRLPRNEMPKLAKKVAETAQRIGEELQRSRR
jgi:DNA-binding IclR family transcriptional regulator